jgi:hypothetical protein
MAATQQMSLNITDSSESAAYANALMQPTPATKAAMMEAFLQTYPHSAGRYSLLVALLGIYWSIPDPEKTLITAKTILADNPHDLRALMFAVRSEVVMSQKAKSSDPKTAARILDDAAEFARKGLSASQPSGMSDLSYQNMKTTATDLFGNVLAMDAEATMDTEGPTPEPTQSAQAKLEPSAEEPGFVPEKTETTRSPRKTVATRSKAPTMKPGPPSASKSVAAAEREECHPVNQAILVTTRSLTGPAECHGETEATLTNRLKDTVECEVVFHQNGIFEPRTASKIEIAPGQTIQGELEGVLTCNTDNASVQRICYRAAEIKAGSCWDHAKAHWNAEATTTTARHPAKTTSLASRSH